VEKALDLLDETNATIADIEEQVEEEYALGSQRRLALALDTAIKNFQLDSGIQEIEREGYRLQIVRRFKRYWDAEKLRKLVSPKEWQVITDRVPNPDKIDNAVREGVLDLKKINRAFIEEESGTHVRRFNAPKESADAEADRVAEALSA
jgi:hypothetical protein